MRRRAFITLLGGAAAAWPVVARAQKPPMPVIGLLSAGSRETDVNRLTPFLQGLNAMGYVEGQNVAIEYYWAENQYDRLPALAADLVRRPVAVIAAFGGTASALAAKAATASIPVLFMIADDPVKYGLVESLNRPGGNATGVSSLGTIISAKVFEVLHEAVPKTDLIGVLVNPGSPTAEFYTKEIQAAAQSVGQKLLFVKANVEGDFEAAFTTLAKQRVGALLIPSDGIFNSWSKQLAALAARHRIPTIYPVREAVVAGGLMSYGHNLAEEYRQVGVLAGRILKGEQPADLPVQQVVKIELTLNLKTATALGLEIPQTLLARADEVIE